MHGLPEGSFVLATVHEYGLGAEHFGHLGENGSPPLLHEPVGEYSEKRIRGNAREAVGASALQADAQFAHRNILANIVLAGRINPAQTLKTIFDLVLDFLAGEHLHAAFVDRSYEFAEGIQLVVLAAEAHDQHAARIGMVHHVGEHLAGVFVVAAQLGAAVIVREGDDSVDVSVRGGNLLLETADYLFADAVHATDRRDDPYLVADSHLAVCTAVALEDRSTPCPFLRVFGHNCPIFGLAVPVFGGFRARGCRFGCFRPGQR